MCVQQKGHSFEGPSQKSDIAILSTAYPGIDFAGLQTAMSVYGFVPLASDLAMIGAAMSIKSDAWGVSFLPFAGVRYSDMSMVKLPVMRDVVGWLENTALGTDMWLAASSYLAEHHDVEVRFAMDCGCGIIQSRALDNGLWKEWLTQFNNERRDIFGRTDVAKLEFDDVDGTNLNQEQLDAWLKLRNVLFSLSPRVAMDMANAA